MFEHGNSGRRRTCAGLSSAALKTKLFMTLTLARRDGMEGGGANGTRSSLLLSLLQPKREENSLKCAMSQVEVK